MTSICLKNVKGILNSFKQLLLQIFHSIISLYLAFAEKAYKMESLLDQLWIVLIRIEFGDARRITVHICHFWKDGKFTISQWSEDLELIEVWC